jgi:predicted TIM-barrel fold metal-dependent hydrolase
MSRSSPLAEAITATPWIDVHEHLVDERHRLGEGGYEFTEVLGERTRIPGDWSALITGGYAIDDLVSAGLPADAALRVASDGPEPLEKWDLIEPHLDAARLTGSVRAVDLTTERLFGRRLARDTCEEIDLRCRELRRPGYYRDVLHDVANVESCQVNSLDVDPFCETEMPELFDQDISIAGLVRGAHPRAEELSGIAVGSLDDYLGVIDWTFERYAGQAVAAKCFWAYFRSLAVGEAEGPPRRAFERLRAGREDAADRRRVEDFLFRRCVELATAAGLPVKMHLGSLARTNDPHLEWIYTCVADMTRLVQEYPRTTFVLMHMAWPQQEQLLALAKHQPNVVVEMSWAWTSAPRSAADFLERFLTTVPATKLLGFGADYQTVENVVGHAEVARRGLERALQSLVDSGWMGMDDALRLVPLIMRENAARLLPSPTRPPAPSVAPS